MTPEEVTAVSRWQLSITEKVIGGAVMALLGWMAFTTQTTATKMAVIEARLSMMSNDPYTSADAVKDKQITDEKIVALSARVETLERAKENAGGIQ